MNSLKTIKVYLLLGLLFAASIFAGGCGSKNTDNNSAETSAQTDISLSEAQTYESVDLAELQYDGRPYGGINDNIPSCTEEDITNVSFEL